MPLNSKWIVALAPSLALVSCSLAEWPGRAEDRTPAKPVAPPVDAPVDLGDPYTIDSVQYRPMDSRTLDETGYAGLSADLDGISIAHKTLPIPSYVELTELGSGRTILARVIERGPMTNSRLVDLSCAAAAQLGLSGGKPLPMRVRRIRPTPPDAVALDRGERAAERLPAPKAMLPALTKKLPPAPRDQGSGDPCADIPPASPPIGTKPPEKAAPQAASPATPATSPAVDKTPASDGFIVEEGSKTSAATPRRNAPAAPRTPAAGGSFAVQAGAFADKAKADRLAARVGGHVERTGTLYRVRTGPYGSRATAANALAKVRAKGFADARIVPMDSR